MLDLPAAFILVIENKIPAAGYTERKREKEKIDDDTLGYIAVIIYIFVWVILCGHLWGLYGNKAVKDIYIFFLFYFRVLKMQTNTCL